MDTQQCAVTGCIHFERCLKFDGLMELIDRPNAMKILVRLINAEDDWSALASDYDGGYHE